MPLLNRFKSSASNPHDVDSVREENLNLTLAELLAERGLKALGEVILSIKGRRAEPDVMIVLNGVRIVIEGKKLGSWAELYTQCEDRLDNNVCDLCVMVEYAKVESASISPTQADMKQALLKGKFNVGFQSYQDRATLGRWMKVEPKPSEFKGITFDEFLTYLMTAYTNVVSEDIIEPVVSRMDEVLKNFANSIATTVNLERLKSVMELREKGDKDESD